MNKINNLIMIALLLMISNITFGQRNSKDWKYFALHQLGPIWFDITSYTLKDYTKKNNIAPLTFDNLAEYTKSELTACFNDEILNSFKIYNNIPLNDIRTNIGVVNKITQKFGGSPPSAQTFENNIYMEDFEEWKVEDRRMLIHELVHVWQYYHLGYDGFKEEYKVGFLESGEYKLIPLEAEAYKYSNSWPYVEKLSNNKAFELTCTNVLREILLKNYKQVDKYINPDYGLYFIYQGSGVLEEILHSKKSKDLFENKNYKDYFAITEVNEKKYGFDKVPNYSCETEEWDIDGVFYIDYKKGKQFTFEKSYLINSELYDPVKTYFGNLLKIKNDFILVSTDNFIAMYFKKISNKYYLTCIHYLSYCSA